jgi:hypothetical protein
MAPRHSYDRCLQAETIKSCSLHDVLAASYSLEFVALTYDGVGPNSSLASASLAIAGHSFLGQTGTRPFLPDAGEPSCRPTAASARCRLTLTGFGESAGAAKKDIDSGQANRLGEPGGL